MIDKIISHYKILEKLGEGGMGVVYKAEDTKLKRIVALKFLPLEFSSDENNKKRFILEAQTASSFDHSNICTIHEIGETDDGRLFMVMPYYQGETLKDKISKGQIEINEAVDIILQICKGLDITHKNNIVHRDIKPANIFITADGVVKLLDFGLAKAKSQTQLTKIGDVVGTINYMSPEQTKGINVDNRTDIWSLGVVAYEMLTNQLPFKGDYQQAIIFSILYENPIPLTNLNPDLPDNLTAIVNKMLQKEVEKRYQSVLEIQDELNLSDAIISNTDNAYSIKSKDSSPSIAVLPFKDISSQHDQDYLCEGFAEEMINALAQVEGLKIAARTSSFSFKGKEEDIRTIGKSLNVDSVLEGSIQKSGSRLRITVQLVNAADGYHLWSDHFDRNVEDVFAVQDEISMTIVDKLRVKLLKGEKEKVTKRHTMNEIAYEFYLKGRYHWNSRTPKDMFMAVDFFQRAIDADPKYVLPYVGIADVFNMFTEFGFIEPRKGYLKSKALLQKALELDESVSEIYSSLALITYCYEWDLPAAERYTCKSIELNQQSSYARLSHAEILGTQGRYEEAIEEIRKGIELDPLYSLAYSLYGILLATNGQKEKGLEQILKSLAMEPDNPMIMCWLGMAYLGKPADLQKAVKYLQKAADKGVTLALGFLGMALGLQGKKEEAVKIIERLRKIEKEFFLPFAVKLIFYFKPAFKHFSSVKKKYLPHYLIALIYLGLNMQEDALYELEKSSLARDYLLPVQFSFMEKYEIPGIQDFISSPRYKVMRSKIKIDYTKNEVH